PPSLQTELYQCGDEYHHKQHPRDRGGIAHLAITEGVAHHLLDKHRRSACRAALRHHPHLVEHLERVDQRDNGDEKERWSELRERDVAQLLKAPRAIERSSLVIVVRDGLQASEEQHQDEAE